MLLLIVEAPSGDEKSSEGNETSSEERDITLL